MNNKIKYVIVLIFLISFAGCGFWDNFTTYFNRYYNAVDKFEEAEEIIQKESTRELFEFKEPKIPGSANTSLDAVIEKCSNILQWNKESAYVEDAIMMIGKAYYYRGNFTKALRKFNELEAYTESDLALENKLWIGKSELQMRRFEDGMQTLDNVKIEAKEEGEEDFLIEAYLSQIRFLVYRENYNVAISNAVKLLEVSDSDALSAEISYEIGKLYVLVKNYENASTAFADVFEYSPTFDIEFKAQIEYANVLKLLGKLDESMEILEDLRDESKYSEDWDRVELEMGNIYYAKNDLEEALSTYLMVDTTYKNSENAGIAAFKRAELIEKEYFEFDSSKILYDRVNKVKAPIEYKNRAKERSFLLTNRRKYSDEIFKNERQLMYLKDTTLYRSDSASYDNYYALKDSLALLIIEMKELEGNDFDSTKYAMDEEPPLKEKPILPTVPEDSLITRICLLKYELGNLYFIDLEVPDSAYKQYTGILENYPQNKYEARSLYALGSYYLTINEKEKADSLFMEVYENHNYDPVANAAAEKLGLRKITTDENPAEKKFIIAEDLYLNNEYNSAIDSLYLISEMFPESPIAAKSLFTIGWILENDLNMLDSAAIVYDTLSVRYGRTEYASTVTKKLGAYKKWEKEIRDSLLQIEQALKDSLKADSLSNITVASPDSVTVIDSISVIDSTAVEDSIGVGQPVAEDKATEQDSSKNKNQNAEAVQEEQDSSKNENQNAEAVQEEQDSSKNENQGAEAVQEEGDSSKVNKNPDEGKDLKKPDKK